MAESNILVAGQPAHIARSLTHYLEPLGCLLHVEPDAGAALQIVHTLAPDIILLDVNTTLEDGREVFRILKNDLATRPIPIILTAPNADLQFEYPEALDYLAEPIDWARLLDSVTRITQKGEEDSGEEALTAEAILTETEFTLFQDFLLRKAGLHYDNRRRVDLSRALRRRMPAAGFTTFREYYNHLTQSRYEEQELTNLILHLTVGETTFFRSPDQFKALTEYILPEIRQTRGSERRLRLWSAGCATGEEPYSLAMTLTEEIPDYREWNIDIVATDINRRFLYQAERAVYNPRKMRFLEPSVRDTFFVQQGDDFRVVPEIREMVSFDYHNLAETEFSRFEQDGGFDIIFCRNVLIYFKRDRIGEVVAGFRNCLRERGFLMLGYSETLFQISTDFRSIHHGDAFFYQKKTADELARGAPAPTTEPGPVWPSDDRFAMPEPAPPRRRRTDFFTPATQPPRPEPPPLPPPAESPAAVTPAPPPAEPADLEEDALWHEGLNHYFLEQFEEAAEAFEKIRYTHPDSPKAQLGDAFLLANSGQDSAAWAQAQEAIGRDKLLVEGYYLLALLAEKMGDIQLAVDNYHKVLLLDAEFAMAHFNLAILNMKRGREKDAARGFRNTLDILRRYPENAPVRFSGGLYREALMQLCAELRE